MGVVDCESRLIGALFGTNPGSIAHGTQLGY